MQIEKLKTSELIPYARNSRTHSEEQVAQIAASIKEFGFTNPVLVDAENVIIAGHGRVMAARLLKLDEVPCIRLAHLTENQKRAYVIADNKLALNAGWDVEMLKVELDALAEMDFDIKLTGFNYGEINNLTLPIESGVTDANAEWLEMPEFEDPVDSFRKVIVHFECKDDAQKFFEVIGQKGTDKTKSIWFPERERESPESMRYVRDEEDAED